MTPQNASTEFIKFTLKDDSKSSALKTEVEAADSGKKRDGVELWRVGFLRRSWYSVVD